MKMDKLNFPDLEKITAPYSLWDDDTRERARDSRDACDTWEVLNLDGKWELEAYPFEEHLTYRRAPVPVTQMTIPWHLVPEGYDVAAADEGGEAHAFGALRDGYVWHASTFHINDLPGFDRGTVDWKDSFQRRPVK